MNFSQHIEYDTILRLHAAAIRHFVERTSSLLLGIDPAFRVVLPLSYDESTGLLGALDVMNRTERLSDGSVPLALWLRNAAALLAHHDDAHIFEAVLARIDGAPPPEARENLERPALERAFILRDIAAGVAARAADVTRVAAILGVPEVRLPPGTPVEARIQGLLVDACRLKRSNGLRALGAELHDPDVEGEIGALADALDAGRWPRPVDDVWIQIQRRGAGWTVDVAVGRLGLSARFDLASGQRAEIAPGTKLSVDATTSGARVRVFSDLNTSPLGAARARIWAGAKAISERLRPRPGDPLGTASGLVMLDLFMSIENGGQE